jgi:hypothetical protein
MGCTPHPCQRNLFQQGFLGDPINMSMLASNIVELTYYEPAFFL